MYVPNVAERVGITTTKEALQRVDSVRIVAQICEKERDDMDLISRATMLEQLCEGCELFHRNGEEVCLSKCEEYHWIASMPSIQPKRPQEWIYSDLLRVKHGTMNIDALIDKVYADMRESEVSDEDSN